MVRRTSSHYPRWQRAGTCECKRDQLRRFYTGAWPSGKATGFGPVILGSNPSAPATLYVIDIEQLFDIMSGPISREIRGIFRCRCGALNGRDESAPDPGRRGPESLPGGFQGFTFRGQHGAPKSRNRGSRANERGLANRTGRLSLLKAKQLPLFSPVDRYLRCQSHQLLGGELWRVLAVDNCGDDVGRQRGKT